MYGERLKFWKRTEDSAERPCRAAGDQHPWISVLQSENNEPNIAALGHWRDFARVTIDFLVGRTDEEA